MVASRTLAEFQLSPTGFSQLSSLERHDVPRRKVSRAGGYSRACQRRLKMGSVSDLVIASGSR
jgi:hypothetical protein